MAPVTESAYDRVALRLAQVTGWRPPNERSDWRCPAHDDRTPSLSVNRGTKGVILKCQAGCELDAILARLDLRAADLFDVPLANGRPDIVSTYDYVDEDGKLLFQVVRMLPKDFRQRRPAPDGSWEWRLADTRRVLYRLPRVLEAIQRGRRIFVVEGEKDVHAVEGAGEVATCNPAGAGSWRDEYARSLTDAHVVVVADRDEKGRQHARQVAASLNGIAASVVVVEAVEGKDVHDHLAAGRGLDELHVQVEGETSPDPQPDVQLAVAANALALEIVSAAQHAARVDALPPVGWLVRRLWPADAHGVLAAEQKAGKTWADLDLAVSVASGTPWMGLYEVDTAGPVLVFLGEGGQRKMLRRLRAVCEAKGLRYEDLPIRLCFRVPHLTSAIHLSLIAEEVAQHRPVLVIVDPLYLAARGAKTSQLNEMGEHLENLQHVVNGAALAIIHHWNKTGEGKGARRMTGAGGAEWGRVLVSVSIVTKSTDKATSTSSVILDWDFEGDEIADAHMRLRRRVWTDDPDDLSSPMHYVVEEVDDEPGEGDEEFPGLGLTARRVVLVLRDRGDWMTTREVGDVVADEGHPLKKRTIQEALKEARMMGLVSPSGDPGTAYQWRFCG